MDSDNKIVLNIGGQRFETNRTTLKKIPATRLSRLTEALANYDRLLNEYFFDRHPGVFSQILNYYRTGKLHYPNNVCGPLFEAELEFWGLDSNQVEPCCWKTYTKHRDTEETLETLERLCSEEEKTSKEDLAIMFGFDEDSRYHNNNLPWYLKIKPIIWQMFHEPNSSRASKTLTYVSVFFITISIITFCLSTVNDLCQSTLFCRSYNLKVTMMNEQNDFPSYINIAISSQQRVPNILDYVEYVCIIWFTLEFGIKCIVAPNKLKFFKSPVTWIDLIANLWFYIDIIYNYFLFSETFDTHPAWDLFGTIRIMRLFKLFNHYPGLKIIIASLKASAAVLRLLVFFIGVAVIIFASVIYYSEKLAAGNDGRNGMSSIVGNAHVNNVQQTNDNQFHSIVEAIWFAVASLTTVGFGDYCPKTPLGMVFGAMCTVTGVLMIDLPMPIIVGNFANYYNHLQAHSKFPKKLRRKVLSIEIHPREHKHPNHHHHHNQTIRQSVNSSATIALVTSRINQTATEIRKQSIAAHKDMRKLSKVHIMENEL
ncbi:unnamed protein product [Brachionus calyciflorus]|uniref:BTB domain-containing protein n=1 Tax=Brachionus calyciflorus TaxID=104777 RepID=A0A813YIV5_9BILA|nr:unnamed protein product [Brachionus calyciflorus]